MSFFFVLFLALLPLLAWTQAATAPAQPPRGSSAPAAEQSQQGPPAADQPERPARKPSSVPPNAPVISIDGLCSDSAAHAKRGASASTTGTSGQTHGPTDPSCKTVVTRAEFEKLVELLNIAPPMRRQLATVYPRLLLFADAAKSIGLEQDPRFQEMLHFATLQILAQEFTRAMQKKAADISDAEIQQYYKENADKFEQIELQRVFTPKTIQQEGAPAPKAAKSDPGEAPMKALADKLHQRAVAGEDFTALQKEAFAAAGLKGTEPNVSLGKTTRGNLPATHEKVYDLKPGQVSDLISDPGGYYLYKVISRHPMPLAQAQPQIRNALQAQRLQESMEGLMSKIHSQLNPEYFAGEAAEGESEPAGRGAEAGAEAGPSESAPPGSGSKPPPAHPPRP
jgi:hypothetical protein